MTGQSLRLSGASAVDHLSLSAVWARKNYKLYLNDVRRQIVPLSEKLIDVSEHKYELLAFHSYFCMHCSSRNMMTRKFISRWNFFGFLIFMVFGMLDHEFPKKSPRRPSHIVQKTSWFLFYNLRTVRCAYFTSKNKVGVFILLILTQESS